MVLLRLPQLLLVMLGCTLLSFCVVNVLPGDILHSILGEGYNAQAAAALSNKLGLDKPLLVRYVDWLGNALRGDFGESLTTSESVASKIGRVAPPSIELMVLGQVVAIVLAVTAAVASVVTRRRWLDRLITAISLVSNSMPPFVVGLLLLQLLSVKLHLISSIGWVSVSEGGLAQNLAAIALPSFILGLALFPGHMRVFRRELMDQIEDEEYITLARMKGITTARIIGRHVARNSMFGLLTVIGISTANLLAATVILEQIFSIPGLGSLLTQAVTTHDSTTVVGCIALISVVVVSFNLLIDIGYAALDPRVRDAANA